MSETRIGRLLAACLHQAIVDVIPERLEFYEVWLGSEALRDRGMGLAPMSAVLGFLRTEPAYALVMARGGQLAAEWTVEAIAPFRRRMIDRLPRTWRTRAALRIAAGIVRHVCSTSRASGRVRRQDARLLVTDSLFCTVRERQAVPLCGFYEAVATGTLAAFGLRAAAHIEACHAVQGASCVIALNLSGTHAAADPALAA
jgi:hypothetical protein